MSQHYYYRRADDINPPACRRCRLPKSYIVCAECGKWADEEYTRNY